jgi:hypothetical protein
LDICIRYVIDSASNQKFHEAYQSYRVMFYHSQEPRHLHYHQIEAIQVGMPVIFMKNSLLDRFSNYQSIARCSDLKEAEYKLELILKGNQPFIEEVIKSNQLILDYFSEENYRKNLEILNINPIIK